MDKIESAFIKNDEFSPEALGQKFNELSSLDFMSLLEDKIKSDPNIRFTIIADWGGLFKARAAKAIWENRRLNIDSITIRATRAQYNEDVNAFQSGVKWEEVQ